MSERNGHRRKTGIFARLRRLLTAKPSPEAEDAERRMTEAIQALQHSKEEAQKTVALVRRQEIRHA